MFQQNNQQPAGSDNEEPQKCSNWQPPCSALPNVANKEQHVSKNKPSKVIHCLSTVIFKTTGIHDKLTEHT